MLYSGRYKDLAYSANYLQEFIKETIHFKTKTKLFFNELYINEEKN